MVRLSVISVPHTGTHFLFNVLERLGFPWPSRRHIHVATGPSAKQSNDEAERWVEGGERIVVPLRSRDAVRGSHVRRGEQDHSPALEIVERWRGRSNVHHFRVDGPEEYREQEVAALAEFLGVPHPGPLDWTPVRKY